MDKLFLNLKATLIIAVLSLIGTGVLTWSVLSFAQAVPAFRTGDIVFQGANNTTGGGLTKPVSAVAGNAIELRIYAQNLTAGTTANNVRVSASVPDASYFANALRLGARIEADNASAVNETIDINVSGSPQAINYLPGHVRIFSPSCPNGCVGSDDVISGNVSVGNLGPGESAQVFFKVIVTNVTSGATPPPSMACPSVNFVLPPNIQPSSDIQIRVNTSGGSGWAFVTLWKDGSRVPTSAGADLGGGSFQWTVNSGASGSVHPLAFRVNDFDAYPGNGSGSGQECGTSSFTTTTPATPPPTTPPSSTPAPQGGSTNNNNNTNNQNSNNTNNNANSNTNNNNNSANATGGTGGSSSSSSNSSSSSSVNLTFNHPSPTPSSTTTNTSTTTTRSSVLAQATSTTSAPKVVAVAGNQELTQLPKTGLPLLAWGVAALLPAGFKLKGKKNTQEKSANSVWEERALKV